MEEERQRKVLEKVRTNGRDHVLISQRVVERVCYAYPERETVQVLHIWVWDFA